jgi:hypothetical protein
MNPGDPRFLYSFSFRDDENGKAMTDNLRYIFLELPKCSDTQDFSVLEKFGYALRNMQNLDSRPIGMDGEIFDLLFDSAELSIFTPTEKIKYENEMTTERDTRNQIAYARKEGREEREVEIAQNY